ncbi:hypothetical protein CN680_29375 [Bacillus pseudomycoides]|uniref:Uncharacterized protein n=1 Tax=Bacillus pseudomycoides TaxID=64104 RepID=A0A2B6RAL6_9BACI|nr:hypothetical protein CON79_29890 [Bacillus pseudomycoides]PEA80126.1 hypothetical protein CON99_30120 [Bacillus pseudomycoides]PED71752.1 hypothetical protein CON97_12395 [Bacillus pseudomycoides]PEI31310.1 hypothetical protein CN620_29510 [Bacillus pseudomycoides]PEJ65151.1 hypothetical protein CN680_29375 [Bacillus pseudomycoides]
MDIFSFNLLFFLVLILLKINFISALNTELKKESKNYLIITINCLFIIIFLWLSITVFLEITLILRRNFDNLSL